MKVGVSLLQPVVALWRMRNSGLRIVNANQVLCLGQ
jgi:hypothetical protein